MNRPTFAVHVSSSRHMPQRVRLAAQLAVAADAHLVGVASTLLSQPYYLNTVGSEAAAALAAYLDEVRARAAADLAAFDAIADQAGVTSRETRIVDDEVGMALGLQGRYSDLLIVGQSDPDETPNEPASLAEYVVMNSGRPVLVCPYAGHFDEIGKRCLVAWDGSLEAARAISGALPVLRSAEKVVLSIVDPKVGWQAHGEEPGADMALYLARHGVQVEVAREFTGDRLHTSEVLLSQAADAEADLLVMGAYGHSRLREVLLGGVTETFLHCMTVPVLMSH